MRRTTLTTTPRRPNGWDTSGFMEFGDYDAKKLARILQPGPMGPAES